MAIESRSPILAPFVKAIRRTLTGFSAPSAGELALVADSVTGHLVQIDETGKIIDLAATIQQDSVGMDSTLLYNFDTTVESWTVTGGTIAWTSLGGGAVDLVDTSAVNGIVFRSPAGLSINGAKYYRVKLAITRLSGSGWNGRCLYTTAGHGESLLHYKQLPQPASFAIGETIVMDFNMSALTVGGTDWTTSTITQFRVDLSQGAPTDDSFRVEWIGVGRNAPVQPATSTVAGAANQIQYNSGSSSFAADANFTFDAATDTQSVPNILLDSSLLNSTLPATLSLKGGAKKNALILPRHIDEFGAEYLSSPAFWQKNFSMFTPSTGTTGTGTVIGGTWTASGTPSHPTPAITTRAGLQHRTRYGCAATTTNQVVGPLPTAPHLKYCRANASAKIGGYLYCSRFTTELLPNGTLRIFAGMGAAITGSMVTSDSLISGYMGFFHSTTDPLSGAGAWNFIAASGTSVTIPITPSAAIAQGQLYEAWIYAPPGETSPVMYKLVLLEDSADTVIVEGQVTLTGTDIYTGVVCPLMVMSNGTVNTGANSVGPGVCNITCIETN